ncbi:DUF3857 domain-containing protein [Chryseolinea lacunae]|uniref:DUF3857 domain-containing protein n=1 Tax=Chryseolinea lacunae TaxID=2801331 RepID=A0ABS1KR53_9BACT|nr:DUF3857 domain-containing protein [Chryseolinea lacunae]MBL0741815.1 DUF3857 domain-containing protein [Chryseolinea lacunae]
MKGLSVALLITLIACCGYAQKSPMKFGILPLEDLKMEVYDKDSSAAAVILADYGEAYLEFHSLRFERHVRIKILRKEGLGWADVQIPLFRVSGLEERVTKLKASTFNLENGRLVETSLDGESVFKEKFNTNINLYKFTFPNVKEGSIIEYSYTLVSDFLANFPNWQFQYKIPVRFSEYWAVLPDYLVFQKFMQGYIPPTLFEVKERLGSANYRVYTHHWISKDVPAFKTEPFMTSEHDYVSQINMALSHLSYPRSPLFEIMGSWKKLNDRLLESEGFGRTITGSNFLKAKTKELTDGKVNQMQKLEAIFNYVQQTLEWNGSKDKYPDDDLKKVVEQQKGTAADINIVLASMLEKAGIAVDMVLLSTRDHGFVRPEYPMERQLNYAIALARVEDKTFLLDATEKYLPMGTLPERCLNGQGLVISPTRHGWIDLEPKIKSRTSINSDLVLTDTGELNGTINYTYDGYAAQTVREKYTTKGEADYLKDFLSTRSWDVRSSKIQDIKDVNKSPRQSHELTIRDHTTMAGDVIYINPLLSEQTKENIFKAETREYPVDFGTPSEIKYLARFTVPPGFVVDEMPKPKLAVLPDNAAKFSYATTQVGDVISVVSVLQINKSMFVQDEYPPLREFYNLIVAKHAEQIVLKKK